MLDRHPRPHAPLGLEILAFLGTFTPMPDFTWLGRAGVPREVLTLLPESAPQVRQGSTVGAPSADAVRG